MNRILLIVGGALVGLLAALFTVPVFVDWNRYRGTFEEEATRLLGRDVRVSGRVNLRLLPTPYIRFEKVRIADTQGGVGEPIFKAEDFTIWLAVGPLFAGVLEANEIELKKPVLTLVLDDQGSGNWSDLGATKSTATFLPSSVALNAVRITDGTVTLLAPGAIERVRLEHINGELAAGSLQGPFKIAAAYASQGAMHDIRLSTAAPEADGTVRFKGTVRSLGTGASFTLDGRARDILTQLKVEGELTAKVPLPGVTVAPGQAAAPGGDSGLVDIRSAFKADTEAIEFSDIALAFEQSGRPQLASGTARMAWRQRTDLDLTLTSKWLDLDRIGGDGTGNRPLALLARLARHLGGGLPTEGRTLVRLELDQATLGGEVVSGLSVALERSADNALMLKSLTAALPGNSRIEASGALTPANAEALFDGAVVLRGASLSRLLAWAARGLDVNAFGQDGSFALTGRMRLGEATFEGRNLALQAGRHSLAGEASWTGGSNRKLKLMLDGTELDLSPVIDREARPLTALRSAIDRLFAMPGGGAGGTTPGEPMDVQARVRFGRVLVGKAILTDIAADLTYTNGNLGLAQLRLGHPDEWQLELRGDIAGLLRPGARGNVAGTLIAQTPERIDDVLALLDLPAEFRPAARRAGHLAPLRLAGRLAVGEKGPETYDLQVDGRAGQSRIAGTLLMTHKTTGWRDSMSDLAVTLDGSDARQLLGQLLPETLLPDLAASATARHPVRTMLRAIGVPKDGLTAVATFDGVDAAAEWRGKITVTDTAELNLAGDLRLTAADLGASLAAAGYRARPALAAVPVNGVVTIASGGNGRWTLASNDLDLAGNRLTGKLALDAAGPATKIAGQVSAARASLPYALALLSTAELAEPRRPGLPASAAAPRPTWPAGVFDLAPLSRFDIAISLDAAQLEIVPAVAVTNARLEITAREGTLVMKLPNTASLAGTLSGGLTLTRGPSAMRLTGTAARANGRFDLKLDIEAAGQGPQSLIGALKGTGELRLAETRLAGLAPTAPRTVAEAIAALKGELPQGEVRRQLEAALAVGELRLGARAVAIEIADGIARLAPITVETADGRVTGTTVVDLATLKVDSEWRLDPLPLPAERRLQRPPVPGIVLVYTGDLARPDALTRGLQLDGYERELIVRKYERDVEELERVRRDDEERVRQEAERRRLEDVERQPRPPENDGATPARPAEPQKQTGLDPPRLVVGELLLPPKLPPLSLLPLRPEARAKLPETDEPATAPAAPATTAGSIPASAETTPRSEPRSELPRPATAPAPAPRPKRDVFRDISRDSP